MRDLLPPINGPYLVQGVDVGAKSTMHTQYLLIDNGRQRQTVEHIGTVFPDIQ